MTVAELIDKLSELDRPGFTVDARYCWRATDECGIALPDCYVDDMFEMSLPSGEGYVTLILGDPS